MCRCLFLTVDRYFGFYEIVAAGWMGDFWTLIIGSFALSILSRVDSLGHLLVVGLSTAPGLLFSDYRFCPALYKMGPQDVEMRYVALQVLLHPLFVEPLVFQLDWLSVLFCLFSLLFPIVFFVNAVPVVVVPPGNLPLLRVGQFLPLVIAFPLDW